jgi:hypothetical protein
MRDCKRRRLHSKPCWRLKRLAGVGRTGEARRKKTAAGALNAPAAVVNDD